MPQYRTVAGPQEYPRKPPILWTDFLMLAVAVVSMALIGWVDIFRVPGGPWHGAIAIADYATCGIFALEFLWRWRREDWSWNFPFLYWYEILCLVPACAPYFDNSGTKFFRSRAPMPWVINQRPSLVWQMLGE